MSPAMNRRRLLRGLGASAIAASLAQVFAMHKGRAAAMVAPAKVVFFYTPCGLIPDLWHPAQTGTNFELPTLSKPLEAVKSDCIFMDGVAMLPLSDHGGGSQQLLAGDDKDRQTLDLQLGQRLSQTTPFASLQLGVQTNISKGSTHPHISRHKLGDEVRCEDNPLVAFDRVFKDFSAPGNSTTPAAGATAERAQLLRRRKSVLDGTVADLKSLQVGLPGSERGKIDGYLSSLAALERALLEGSSSTSPVVASSCRDFESFNQAPNFLVPAVTDPSRATYNMAENKQTVADLQMELARLALACGRTRVVTLMFEHTNAKHPIVALNGKYGVHDASHFGKSGDEKWNEWNADKVWYAERFKQFIQMLKDTPDVTGSLLDNTIVLHCSELGGPGHTTQRVPFVFAGGSALGFKLGQAINFTGTVPEFTNGNAHYKVRYLAHSTLLTAITQKLELPLPSGETRFGFSGPQALDPRSVGIWA